ncbi:MAG: hypothetical protein Q7S27_07230 [Nanoarchaeota archaeon]|nr:hypothetical protein [Nanoarchaeota archaeon]
MNFQRAIIDGHVRKVVPNSVIARNLMKSSEESISTAFLINQTESSLKSIYRELYEGLRQYCEAIGFLKGFEFHKTEIISDFLSEVLNEKFVSSRFHLYTQIRSKLDYGFTINMSMIEMALEEIPLLTQYLKKHIHP